VNTKKKASAKKCELYLLKLYMDSCHVEQKAECCYTQSKKPNRTPQSQLFGVKEGRPDQRRKKKRRHHSSALISTLLESGGEFDEDGELLQSLCSSSVSEEEFIMFYFYSMRVFANSCFTRYDSFRIVMSLPKDTSTIRKHCSRTPLPRHLSKSIKQCFWPIYDP
jgi:hypothetical protein